MRDLQSMLGDVAARRPNPDRIQQAKDQHGRRGYRRPCREAWKQLRDHARAVDKAHDQAVKEEIGRMSL